MEDALFRSPYYRVSVKALVVNRESKILLIQGDDGRRDLPGGGLDRGEDPVAGLRREVSEETGLEIQYIAPNPSYFLTRKEDGKRRSNTVYKAIIENFDFTPSKECVSLGFFTAEDALKIDLYPNMPIFLKQHQERIYHS